MMKEVELENFETLEAAEQEKLIIKQLFSDFEKLKDLIRDGKEDAVKELLETKDCSEAAHNRCTSGRSVVSPISVAVGKGQLNIVKMLLKYNLGYHMGYEYPSLVRAAGRGHLKIVNALVEEFGHDVNMKGHYEITPLLVAAQQNEMAVVKYLVECGADVNHNSGAIIHACVAGRYRDEMCQFILSHGFDDIDACDRDGNTALNWAVGHNCEAVVDVLLQHGADVNLANLEGKTPFWNSLNREAEENVDTLKSLLAQGCDPDLVVRGRRPMDHSIDRENYNIVHLLAVTLNLPTRGPELRSENEHNLICRVAGNGRISYECLSTIFLMLKVGYRPSDEEYKALSYIAGERLSGYSGRFINECLLTPRGLADTCCFSIRGVLGKDLPHLVDRLPLPQKLIDFVKLTHVHPDDELLAREKDEFPSYDIDYCSSHDIYDSCYHSD